MVEFLELWRKGNYGEMARRLSPVLWNEFSENVRFIQDEYASRELHGYSIKAIVDEAPAVSEVTCEIVSEEAAGIVRCESVFRLVVSVGGEIGGVQGQDGAEWGLVNWRAG